MPEEIRITFPSRDIRSTAKILGGRSPKTVTAITKALPIRSRAHVWGSEVYFETSIDVEDESITSSVEVGDVAFWPPGRAICLFFGRTPASTSDKPEAYSPVSVFAKLAGDPAVLKAIRDDDEVIVE